MSTLSSYQRVISKVWNVLFIFMLFNYIDKVLCNIDQFTCNNNRCIPNTWRCDGERDCEDW